MSSREWLLITVRSPSVELIPWLSEGLVDCGASAVQEDGVVLRTYVQPDDGAEAFAGRVRSAMEAAADGPVDVTWITVEPEDWTVEWRRGLGARRVGERFVICPTWVDHQEDPRDIVISIDPQMAFGTGEHATTRGVLRLLEAALSSGDRVLDVGTGSGVLAIAAARLDAADVLAVDNDADAVLNARENIERNAVSDRVTLVQADVTGAWLREQHPRGRDVIVANVLIGVLVPLLAPFREMLRPGGSLILGGILAEEAEALQRGAVDAGFLLIDGEHEGEWWSGRFLAGPVVSAGG
jgi:ribosomal protein L11 methyltransferase